MYSESESELLWEDDLRNGIWPRSLVIWIVAFWIALLIVRPWEKLVPELGLLHPERAYAIFAIVAVLLSGRARFAASYQTTGLLIWALAISISAFFAVNPSTAWGALYVYFTLFVFYFVLLCVVRTPYELVFLATCFVVAMALFLGKSQWEYFLHDAQGFSMGVTRLRGMNATYGHPNSVAYSAVISLPFLAFLWKIRSPFTAAWPPLWHRLFPWALAVSFWLVISSVLLTNSRSGMLGVVLAVCLWAWNRGDARKVLLGLVLATLFLACVWTLMPEKSQGRFRNIWDPESGPAAESAHYSARGRIVGLQQGMEMFRRFPATGVGPGNFGSYRAANLDGEAWAAHNTLGAVLGETGSVGGLAFLVFVSGIFANCSRTKRLHKLGAGTRGWIMKEFAVACRDSALLLLFLGMFGDVQDRAQLYWIAAFTALAYTLARLDTGTRYADALESGPPPTDCDERDAVFAGR